MAFSRNLLTWAIFGVLVSTSWGDPRRGFRGRTALKDGKAPEEDKREAKFFPVFSVVQFANEACQSQSSISGSTGATHRNGTCYTNTECSDKGGTVSGGCASGFGVCCVFLVSESGSTVGQNSTYIRNPNYPSAYTSATSVQYTINKCSENVCKLRLDFETFNIQGTGNTVEANTGNTVAGGTCLDTFEITVSTNQRIPQICGSNAGQHMYIDIGRQSSDSVNLNFAFDGTTTDRQWEIKVSQIPCYGASSRSVNPPDGCLQWHTGVTGRFSTFNFLATADNHLKEQDYSVCIRQEAGFCCNQYTPCADDKSFSLSVDAAQTTTKADTDAMCSLDYIAIPESSSRCDLGGASQPVTTKYCGNILNDIRDAEANAPICDCTLPFVVDVFTDTTADLGALADNAAHSRGVCLEWKQIAC